jgi:hypothetical protein
MGSTFGRWVRAALIVGGIAVGAATMMATPNISPAGVTVALADPALKKDTNENHNNDLGSDDNNDERRLKGQVIELHEDRHPPEALVATTGENVWARIYNDQLHRSGMRAGDHVRMQGEYNKGVFDAYEVDVQDRCCSGPNNSNSNNNDNS